MLIRFEGQYDYFQTAGRTALGLGAAGLGVITLLHGDFAITWQPAPAWVPARTALAYTALLLTGAAWITASAVARNTDA